MRLAITKTPFSAATAEHCPNGTVELIEVDRDGTVKRTGEELEVRSPLNRSVPVGKRVSIDEDVANPDVTYLTDVFYT